MKTSRYQSITPFAIISILLLPFLLIPKDESLLIINGWHSPSKDLIFKNVTWLGEGFMIFCCVLLLLFKKTKWLFVFLIGLFVHILLIQINKQFLFNHIYRPYIYMQSLDKIDLLHFVDGIKIRKAVSFPSGHTTGATFAAAFITLCINSKRLSCFLAIVAIMVGISRVYLAQHFFIDIYFGYVFGTFSALIGYTLSNKIIIKTKWTESYPLALLPKKVKTGVLKHAFTRNLRASFRLF